VGAGRPSASNSGLRISEALGLTWEHIELGPRPRVLVREQLYNRSRRSLKSRQGRRDIPLAPVMAERLRAHRRDTFRGDRGRQCSRPKRGGSFLDQTSRGGC
jgi:integrase